MSPRRGLPYFPIHARAGSNPLPALVAPDADALLRRLSAKMQVGHFLQIAAADYGSGGAQHLEGLCRILDGDMPRPLRWHPLEVLELTRWNEPNAGLDPYAFAAAHARRAFACATLLRALGNEIDEPASRGHFGSNQTLIQLVASLRVLDADHDRDAAAMLQWLIPRLPLDEADEAAFHGLALFWFALAPSVGVGDAELLGLADWIMAAEDAVSGEWRESLGAGARRPWLLSMTTYTLRHEVWRAFAGWLVERAAPRAGVREIAGLMAAAMLEPKSAW